ncbi:MAG: ATP-binding protein [Planctomycetota bacterium]
MSARQYTAADIEVLKGLGQVRRRPVMYVGSLCSRGLHELLTILLDNSIDEARAGHARRLTLTLGADGSVRAEDDGRGIPVTLHERADQPTLELVFTMLGACYCGCENSPGHRRSLYGLGMAVVNALSEWLVVETNREGMTYRLRFERGELVGQLECLGSSQAQGTSIHFLPDRSIFRPDARLDRARLFGEVEGLAALVPGFTFGLVDEREPNRLSRELCCPRGLADLVQSLAEQPRLALPIVVGPTRAAWPDDDAQAELRLALQADDCEREHVIGFVNLQRSDEGTHVHGLLRGLDLGFRDAAEQLGLRSPARRPRGLVAVLAVDIPWPQFEGSTRECLASPPAEAIVERVARAAIPRWARAHPREAAALLRRCPE